MTDSFFRIWNNNSQENKCNQSSWHFINNLTQYYQIELFKYKIKVKENLTNNIYKKEETDLLVILTQHQYTEYPNC